MIGRRYLDPGDRLAGRHDPPLRVTVLTRWGLGGGPRNVLIERADGTRDVVPFPRRLRLDPCPWSVGDRVVWPHREGHGRARRTVLSPGTVIALDDVPGTRGVRVRFDEPLREYDDLDECYATYAELQRP